MSTGPLKVYLAGRSEDRHLLRDLRLRLQGEGIECTSRWLDVEDLSVTSPLSAEPALTCLEDIVAADVFVLCNDRSMHRSGTGGRHVEFGIVEGMALARPTARKPMVIYGDVENVFHGLPFVHVVSFAVPVPRLARVLHLAVEHGTPVPPEVLEV